MHQLIDSLPPPFSRLGGQPCVGAPDRSNRKRNKAVTVFCLLSIFTCPPFTPSSLTPSVSPLSLLRSPQKCASDMSNTHAATPGLNPSSLLAAHAGVALASLSPSSSPIISSTVEFFGDHQTPNVTASATRWQNQDCIA